jgi:hypothetical protein
MWQSGRTLEGISFPREPRGTPKREHTLPQSTDSLWSLGILYCRVLSSIGKSPESLCNFLYSGRFPLLGRLLLSSFYPLKSLLDIMDIIPSNYEESSICNGFGRAMQL